MSERTARPKGVDWRRKMFAALAERDGHHCAKCRSPDRTIWRRMGVNSGELWGEFPWENYRHTLVHPTSNLEVDHKVPLSEGGGNDLDNLWLLCRECHKRKTSGERSARLKRLFAEAGA